MSPIWCWILSIFVHLFPPFVRNSVAFDACQKFAVCVLDKCVQKPITNYPPKHEVINFMLQRLNFGCVFGPQCYEKCKMCESCQYAQIQVQRAILRDKFDGRCTQLESCAQGCLKSKTVEPFGCIFRDRCTKYCLDAENCPQCRDIVRRVFTGYCYRNKFIERYGSKCRPLFDSIVRNYAK